MGKMNKKMVGFPLRWVCVVIFITAIVTSLTTGLIIYNNSKIVLGSASIKDDDALREFLRVYNGLDKSYYEDIDKSKMIDAAIEAMLNYLGEDYSTYMNKEETNNLANRLSGKFLGIGVSISNGNEIVKVHQDTPAEKVGLENNDKIIRINDKDTEGLTQSEVANCISKTEENTIVVLRGEEELTFHVKAEMINTPLTTELIETEQNKIGYISIESFTNTVGEEFTKSLKELEDKGMNRLIIDVRSNSGGYLKGATEIASLFIEKGKKIYSLEGKDKTEDYFDETDEKRDYLIAILMDENSASASEVLIAALKDNKTVMLIGKNTYGKGKVQQTKKLEDGSMVKYTTAKWFTPNGRCIDEIGIAPDYDIDYEQDEEGNYIDSMLEKAIELLS